MKPNTCKLFHQAVQEANPSEPLADESLAHLERCARCRHEWQQMQHTHQLLTRLGDTNSEAASDPLPGRAALLHKIRMEERESPLVNPLYVRRKWAPYVASGLALACLAGLAYRQRGPQIHPLGEPKTAAYSIDSKEAPIDPQQDHQVASGGNALASRDRLTGSQKEEGVLPPYARLKGVSHAANPETAAVSAPHEPTRRHDVSSPRPHSRPDRQITYPPTVSGSSPKHGTLPVTPNRGQLPIAVIGGDDLAYVNDLPPLAPPEIRQKVDNLLRQGDDFITVPLPRIAAVDTPGTRTVVAQAMKNYEEEKGIVDPRLFKKVSLEMKGGDLRELIAALTEKTGVQFYVTKDLADYKLTLFMKDVPARDLMRQVARLFNLQWRRHGEDEKYRYQLTQGLKQKLEEEELRRKDEDQMLLNAVDEMDPYLQYTDTPKEQLQQLAKEAEEKAGTAGTVEERQRWQERQRMLSRLTQGKNMEALRFYASLTPEQLLALRNGESVKIGHFGTSNGMTPETAERIRNDMLGKIDNQRFGEEMRAKPLNDLDISMEFRLDRKQPDRVNLVPYWMMRDKDHRGIGLAESMVSGMPDRLRNPGNTQAHEALKGNPEYRKNVEVKPEAETTPGKELGPLAKQVIQRATQEGETVSSNPSDWVDSADVFEELHRRTGRNILADYYTRIYPRNTLTLTQGNLLGALNTTADVLQSDWQEDGGFLRFRRFNYYTERTLDIPNPSLHKWLANRKAKGIMSLDDLSEAAAFPLNVLRHEGLTKAMMMRYGVDEWPLAGMVREELLFYAKLTPGQRQQAQSEDGLPAAQFDPETLEAFRKIVHSDDPVSPEMLAQGRFHIRLQEPGAYEWFKWSDKDGKSLFPARNHLHDASKESLVAAAEKILKDRGASPQEIKEQMTTISGPGAGIYLQTEAGDHFYNLQSDGFGNRDWSGVIGATRQVERNVIHQ